MDPETQVVSTTRLEVSGIHVDSTEYLGTSLIVYITWSQNFSDYEKILLNDR